MTRIYKTTDRIKVKIDEIEVSLAPLTLDQKTEAKVLQATGKVERNYKKVQDGVLLLIKYALKDIKGVKNLDGSDYKLEFENNMVSDSCINDLLNMEMHPKLIMICSSFANAIPSQFVDNDGKPIEGVELVKTDSSSEETEDPN